MCNSLYGGSVVIISGIGPTELMPIPSSSLSAAPLSPTPLSAPAAAAKPPLSAPAATVRRLRSHGGRGVPLTHSTLHRWGPWACVNIVIDVYQYLPGPKSTCRERHNNLLTFAIEGSMWRPLCVFSRQSQPHHTHPWAHSRPT